MLITYWSFVLTLKIIHQFNTFLFWILFYFAKIKQWTQKFDSQKSFFSILFDSLGTKQIYVYGKIVRLLRIKFNWMFLFRDATRSRPMHECECNQTNEESSSRYRRTHNVQVSLITIYKWGVSHIDMVKSGKKAAAWPEFHTTWDVLFLPIKFVCVKQHNWKDFRDSSLQYSTCLSVCCYLHVCKCLVANDMRHKRCASTLWRWHYDSFLWGTFNVWCMQMVTYLASSCKGKRYILVNDNKFFQFFVCKFNSSTKKNRYYNRFHEKLKSM